MGMVLIPLNARLALINSSKLDDDDETCDAAIEEADEDTL